MGIIGKFFGARVLPSLNSVTFDVSRYSDQGEKNGMHVWFLPEGGGVGLHFFSKPPNLPSGLSNEGRLKEFYKTQMGSTMQMVECRLLTLDGVRSVWLVGKERSKETGGATYLGSYTIPFRDFSFVIKVQCAESGVTGLREAVLVDEGLLKKTGKMDGNRFVPEGWSFDDEQFDNRFPLHPLTRVRQELRLIADSIRIEPRLKNMPGFDLPGSDAPQ